MTVGLDALNTKLIQVSNVAHNATLEQLKVLFSFIGEVEDLKLFPESPAITVQSKVCFVKFVDPSSVPIALHLTNTVFIDKSLIVVPVSDEPVSEEEKALQLVAASSALALGMGDGGGILPTPALIPQLMSSSGNTIAVPSSVPPPPPLTNVDANKVEEIRRTVFVNNLDPEITAEMLLSFFSSCGDIKYIRMGGDDGKPTRYAYIEFAETQAIVSALQYSGAIFGGKPIKVTHSKNAVSKPPPKHSDRKRACFGVFNGMGVQVKVLHARWLHSVCHCLYQMVLVGRTGHGRLVVVTDPDLIPVHAVAIEDALDHAPGTATGRGGHGNRDQSHLTGAGGQEAEVDNVLLRKLCSWINLIRMVTKQIVLKTFPKPVSVEKISESHEKVSESFAKVSESQQGQTTPSTLKGSRTIKRTSRSPERKIKEDSVTKSDEDEGRSSERREKEEKKSRDKDKDRERERKDKKDRDRGRNKDRDRDKERDKDRDRDKERDREKDRERDKDRDKERDRDKDREREKDRDKERDRDKDRDKERDRDKDRDKERDRDRDRDRDKERDKDRHRDRDRRDRKEKTRDRTSRSPSESPKRSSRHHKRKKDKKSKEKESTRRASDYEDSDIGKMSDTEQEKKARDSSHDSGSEYERKKKKKKNRSESQERASASEEETPKKKKKRSYKKKPVSAGDYDTESD
ncbi:predicted protein [Nematostella vectensis]|uniref:RRM domain-containing protein n=1 Tax=Nematostella vectensis TaxID=45351 RepID=A7RX62_NEMVE|nr:predicted protein [Nematostella vectensis]|eukprot:XP_001636038.1 predicted protein [Nematostella vectensis]